MITESEQRKQNVNNGEERACVVKKGKILKRTAGLRNKYKIPNMDTHQS
jgi:hypothetical protein